MWITLTTPQSPALVPPPSSLVPTVRPGRRALAARQLWSAAAAMCLVLLPVAVVGAGLAGAGYGLFASVRWVAGLVETWKGRRMPKWPRWRKR